MRVLLLSLLVAAAPSVAAQMLPSGTWTGTWTAGARALPATAEIERCETGFRVHLAVGARDAHTETATWAGGRLQFTTDRARLPGMSMPRALTCTLAHGEGGRLAGVCRNGRRTYRLTLAPPASGTFGCD